MSIWGHRDSEPPAEERRSAEAQEPAAGHQDGEAATARTGVVVDGESAVKDPALTGTAGGQAAGEQARTHSAEAGAGGEQTWTNDAEAGPAARVVQEPTVAVAREPAVTGGAVASPGSTGPDLPGGLSPQRWSEILVGFVDDPRGSVKMAADAVDEVIGGFVNSLRDRQRDLASTWQGAQADTEQLRTALREYRRLGQRVQQLDLGEKMRG